jgi:predicted helicase
MRQALAEEFSSIHVFNLRGNRRQGGAEGRPIWEAFAKGSGGSIATIAIVVLVKRPQALALATIYYSQVADFTTATEKVAEVVAAGSIGGLTPVAITPNSHGDWLHQRADDFATFMPIESVFTIRSGGIKTTRDPWNYNFSREVLTDNARATLAYYNEQVARVGADEEVSHDPRRISWDRVPLAHVRQGRRYRFAGETITTGSYRPFTKQWVYPDRQWNNTVYRIPALFPAPGYANNGFTLTAPASHYDFCAMAADALPDFHLLDTGQFFARWRYERADDAGMFDVHDAEDVVGGHRKIDNITDEALDAFLAAYPDESISKDDIFDYVYALLHSPTYRETYAADLKKMLPRIPFAGDFRAFADAGKRLAELHLGYETIERYPLEGLNVTGPGGDADYAFFAVGKKMAFAKPTAEQKAEGARNDRSVIHYNERITLRGIPLEAYRYTLGSRSAIEWIIDRYWVKTDRASGIVNDPNRWSREAGNPRYVLDLIARIVTVSLETMAVVDALPPLGIRHEALGPR